MTSRFVITVVGAAIGGAAIGYLYRGSRWLWPVALLYGLALGALVGLLVK